MKRSRPTQDQPTDRQSHRAAFSFLMSFNTWDSEGDVRTTFHVVSCCSSIPFLVGEKDFFSSQRTRKKNFDNRRDIGIMKKGRSAMNLEWGPAPILDRVWGCSHLFALHDEKGMYDLQIDLNVLAVVVFVSLLFHCDWVTTLLFYGCFSGLCNIHELPLEMLHFDERQSVGAKR